MTTLLRSSDLSCPSCIAKIKNHLNAVDGVEDATVHFNTGKIEVEHDPERAPAERLVEAVRAAGYESRVARF
ncbi:MAG: heavy-metal-associated domain-containing protein [Spirochaetaceae bacterium]